MKSAGLPSASYAMVNKRFVLFVAMLYVGKLLRSKLMLKNSALNEFQPNWNFVITSKEQEKNLHAWTCKNCGTTLFIAKGREFRFFNRFTACYNCGASGKDNFYNRRDDIEDDGEFEYESPLNYKMSKKERAKYEAMLEKNEENVLTTVTEAEVIDELDMDMDMDMDVGSEEASEPEEVEVEEAVAVEETQEQAAESEDSEQVEEGVAVEETEEEAAEPEDSKEASDSIAAKATEEESSEPEESK
eukprot:CAMPEP_0195520448 /NCGR_PEP_ID=MMETSP0794_2-20130614/16908_1 /TAXON_ID=515487 /ORGANISM="Stephanopyxis turris, Strain CCMP 815" /LENGTH=244 /DNA_ID=CAMNT_0040649807 /DNA_START=348 /DNA_END=1082 /DNA_ORIENTATION=+